jgi:hypothetical protein
MDDERRKGPRRPFDEGIELSESEEGSVRASGVNISRFGVLCDTDLPLEQQSEVSVHIDIPAPPGVRRFEFKGLVVRSDESEESYKTGISFTSIPEDAEQSLDEFLESYELSTGDDPTLEIPGY